MDNRTTATFLMPWSIGHSVRNALFLHTVPRWGVCRRSREQSVAEHSYRVVVIANEIAMAMRLENRIWMNVLILALYHDSDEAVTGDAPATAKDDSWDPGMTMERKVVYLADKLEARLWARNNISGSALQSRLGILEILDGKITKAARDLNIDLGGLEQWANQIVT